MSLEEDVNRRANEKSARRQEARASPATSNDLPTSEPVPWNMIAALCAIPCNPLSLLRTRSPAGL